MIKKQKKPSLGLVIFGLLITGIILLGMLWRLLFQKSLALIMLRSARKN